MISSSSSSVIFHIKIEEENQKNIFDRVGKHLHPAAGRLQVEPPPQAYIQFIH